MNYGLASYVFTNDSTLADLTAEGLQAGMVGINETLLATAEAPFGGIKESGFDARGARWASRTIWNPNISVANYCAWQSRRVIQR